MIKLVDQLSAMGSFPIATAQDIVCSDNIRLQEKIDNGTLGGGGGGSTATTLTQEEYDALDPQEQLEGEFYCYDSGRHFRNGVEYGKDSVQISDNETVENKTWSSQKTSSKIAEVETELKGNIEEINDSLVDIDSALENKANKTELNNYSYLGNRATRIPENDDLNNYITPGIYTCSSVDDKSIVVAISVLSTLAFNSVSTSAILLLVFCELQVLFSTVSLSEI